MESIIVACWDSKKSNHYITRESFGIFSFVMELIDHDIQLFKKACYHHAYYIVLLLKILLNILLDWYCLNISNFPYFLSKFILLVENFMLSLMHLFIINFLYCKQKYNSHDAFVYRCCKECEHICHQFI